MRSLRAIGSRRRVHTLCSLRVVIRRYFFDQGTRDAVDLLVGEGVAVVLGHAIGGVRLHPALEQSKLPSSQHVGMVDDLLEYAL